MASPTNDALDIKEHVKELKGILNYFQPFLIWMEISDQLQDKSKDKETKARCEHVDGETRTKDNEPEVAPSGGQHFEKILYAVMSTTRNYLCHLSCWTKREYITHMHLNMKNLYKVCGVDLLMKEKQIKLLKNTNELDKENNYYYYDTSPDFSDPNLGHPKELSRNPINETIIKIIKDKHESPEKSLSDEKESIIVFAYIVHHLVGTRKSKWSKITKYFDCYDIEKRAVPNGQKKSLFLKRRDDISDNVFKERFERIKEKWEEISETMKLRKMFNPKSFEAWNNNLHKKLDKCSEENKNVINILISTKNVLTEIHNFTDQKGRYRIYLNLRNLYNFFGINFKNYDEMRDFETLVNLNLSLPEEEKYYYFYEWQSEGETNESHKKTVPREAVNKKIKDLISNGHNAIINGASEMDAASINIIIFGYFLHLFEGNSYSVTKYFTNICSPRCEDGTKRQLKEATENTKERNDKIKLDYDNLMKHLEEAIVKYK